MLFFLQKFYLHLVVVKCNWQSKQRKCNLKEGMNYFCCASGNIKLCVFLMLFLFYAGSFI